MRPADGGVKILATEFGGRCLFKGVNESVKKTRYVSTSFLAKAGFFLGLGLFVLVAVPNFIKARSTPCTNACVNNLRQIDAAANQFTLENHLTNGSLINFPNDLTPYIKLNSAGKIPPCPAGGIYHLTKVGDTPTCSMRNLTPAHVLP